MATQKGFSNKKIGSLKYPFEGIEYYAFELKYNLKLHKHPTER